MDRKKRDRGRRDTELLHRHGVLHDERQHLHEQAEPETEDQDVQAHYRQRGVRAET
jgi:hypothetical protein